MGIYSPDFVMMNTQITRSFGKKLEVYVGGENITNYKQKHAILGNQNPFTQHFDASMIYASVFGAMYYAGVRFHL
jgi:outer membrane receptor for ferrienterochelin and colicins